MRPRKLSVSSYLVCLALCGCISAADYARAIYVRLDSSLGSPVITITLNNSFIEAYRDRATINVRMIVDDASRGPKPAFLDGDFHFSGRVAEVGLPVVAEIKNSAHEKNAIDEVQEHRGTGKPIRVSGAWRIWFEHAGEGGEVQGEEVPKLRYTNPDHVFEIHPVTAVQDQRTLDSFRPVPGYHPGDANAAFANYEKTMCTIIPGKDRTSLVTAKGEYNDAEFVMEIASGQTRMRDGRFVFAAVRDLKGRLLARMVRMVFVKDTEPERIVRRLGPGDRLHVFGLPRLDLDVIARYKEKKSGDQAPKQKLPYEILVVGVYSVELASEKIRHGHERGPDDDGQDRVRDKIRIGHQRDAGDHGNAASLLLPVHEITHADRTEQNAPE